MIDKSTIEDFLAQRTLAVVGASRDKKKFGNVAFRELKAKGYHVFPVNPKAESIDGELSYPSLESLPEPADGLVVVVPPAQTKEVVREAVAAGISRIWLQQGSESKEAIDLCRDHGLSVVHGECILLYARPVTSIHRLHRWMRGLLGNLPR